MKRPASQPPAFWLTPFLRHWICLVTCTAMFCKGSCPSFGSNNFLFVFRVIDEIIFLVLLNYRPSEVRFFSKENMLLSSSNNFSPFSSGSLTLSSLCEVHASFASSIASATFKLNLKWSSLPFFLKSRGSSYFIFLISLSWESAASLLASFRSVI